MLFEDRASQHKSPSRLAVAEKLGIEVRLLPRAARASGVTMREAVKYLPASKRERVLAAWRPPKRTG